MLTLMAVVKMVWTHDHWPVARRVNLLVSALDGAQKTNEALAACADGEEILDVTAGSIK